MALARASVARCRTPSNAALQQAGMMAVRPVASAYAGNAAVTSATVTFKACRRLEFGQHFKVVGGTSSLGDWDSYNAPSMTWGEGDVWNLTVEVPAGRHEFKLVVVRQDGRVDWEPGPNRTLELPRSAFTVDLEWGNTTDTLVSIDSDDEPEVHAPAAVPASVGKMTVEPAAAHVGDFSKAPASFPRTTNGVHQNGAAKLSPEQLAFLERKARSTSPAPAAAAARPRSASPVPATALRPRSSSPVRAPSPAPAAATNGYSNGHSSSVKGLSPEQLAFLERKRKEASTSPAAPVVRARSPSPVARAARPVSNGAVRSAMAGPSAAVVVPDAKLSPEQVAFLERKRQASASPAPAAAARATPAPAARSAAAPAGSSAQYSPEQLAFLERKRQSSSSSAGAAAPSAGRAAGSGKYRYVTADEQARLSKEQCDFLERKRGGSV